MSKVIRLNTEEQNEIWYLCKVEQKKILQYYEEKGIKFDLDEKFDPAKYDDSSYIEYWNLHKVHVEEFKIFSNIMEKLDR